VLVVPFFYCYHPNIIIHMDKKKYIRKLFEVVSITDILIVNKDNQLIQLNVPFTVLVVCEGPNLCFTDWNGAQCHLLLESISHF